LDLGDVIARGLEYFQGLSAEEPMLNPIHLGEGPLSQVAVYLVVLRDPFLWFK
jgi:hypothetical protein